MSAELLVLRDVEQQELPEDGQFKHWVELALEGRAASLALRLVDETEGRELNAGYRGKDRPTNVLSFPAELPETVLAALDVPPLGDLVICAPVVNAEARAQGKPAMHHWAHLTIHGVLHLLGHTHNESEPAERMETLETQLLALLGIPDPYAA